jgi:hypothetical protein
MTQAAQSMLMRRLRNVFLSRIVPANALVTTRRCGEITLSDNRRG